MHCHSNRRRIIAGDIDLSVNSATCSPAYNANVSLDLHFGSGACRLAFSGPLTTLLVSLSNMTDGISSEAYACIPTSVSKA